MMLTFTVLSLKTCYRGISTTRRIETFFAGVMVAIADRLYKEGEIQHKLRWGGDWDGDHDFKDSKFIDLPHFELI